MNSVEKVKALCRERKIPISKLERDLGFANGYIGQLKKGSFPDERLVKIAEYFNVPMIYFYGNSLPETSNDNEEELTYDKLLKIYTRGKNNLSPEEKIKLAQIILADRNGQNGL